MRGTLFIHFCPLTKTIPKRSERNSKMVYSDFSIEQLKQRLFVKALKNSTPKKYAGDMLEAAEVIQQLQARIKKLEADQD